MPHSNSPAYLSATQWLYDRIDYEKLARPGTRYRFSLERMQELIVRLGHARFLAQSESQPSAARTETCLAPGPEIAAAPEDGSAIGTRLADFRPRIVHIAGTKGKGSVAHMIATMLTASGHRVGLYTSPHLVHLEERFRVDGCPASTTEMVQLIDSMGSVVKAMSESPTGSPSFFELTTAIAVEHFYRRRCQFWVLETGLGGRLDSTNVLQSDVTVLTSIGLDHQHVLGDTIELIAKEKAGIFKAGVPAVSGVVRRSAQDVIRLVAAEVKAPLVELGRDYLVEPSDQPGGRDTPPVRGTPSRGSAETARDHWGSSFELVFPGRETQAHPVGKGSRLTVSLSLEGRHQVNNAATAIAALDQLGLPAGEPALDALSRLQIEARLERFELPGGTTVILDAAHNPDSIAALAQTLAARFQTRTVVGVFGTSVDKDAATMLHCLQASLRHVILTRYHANPRFVSVERLAEIAEKESPPGWYSLTEHPAEACSRALSKAGRDGVVVICGSFFLAAEVRPWLVEQASPAC